MLEEMYETLMKKTKGCFVSLKMIAAMLQQMKNKIPPQIFIQYVVAAQIRFKQRLAARGYKVERKFQSILGNLKGGRSFNMLKIIQNCQQNLLNYYETSQIMISQQIKQQVCQQQQSLSSVKTKKIKKSNRKNKVIKRPIQSLPTLQTNTKIQDDIYDSQDQAQGNFTI